MNIIPIFPSTLDLIEKLNNGVRPELEDDKQTFYVYRGEDTPASIISEEELDSDEYPEFMTAVKVLYIAN